MLSNALVGGLIAALLVLVALILPKTLGGLTLPTGEKKSPQKAAAEGKRSFCPLCGSSLGPGEHVTSHVYTGEAGRDKRCAVHGCPYCYPKTEPGIRRVCPVCGQEVPSDGALIGRIFFHPARKKHVHIVGCTECHKKTKKG